MFLWGFLVYLMELDNTPSTLSASLSHGALRTEPKTKLDQTGCKNHAGKTWKVQLMLQTFSRFSSDSSGGLML